MGRASGRDVLCIERQDAGAMREEGCEHPEISPKHRKPNSLIPHLLCRGFVSLENYGDTIPSAYPLWTIPINVTRCSKGQVYFRLLPSPRVQFGRKEPFKMTVKNHSATLPPQLQEQGM